MNTHMLSNNNKYNFCRKNIMKVGNYIVSVMNYVIINQLKYLIKYFEKNHNNQIKKGGK